MAQLQEKPDAVKGGRKRAKKTPMHLDMTPMVDLAFLLLTFFMLTTTFTKLNAMKISMPVPGPETPVGESNALTVLLSEKDKVYYYFGQLEEDTNLLQTDFSADGIRKVLLSDQVKANKQMVVMVKAMKKARYTNLVDVLDELEITDTKRYALVDINDFEKDLIATKEMQ